MTSEQAKPVKQKPTPEQIEHALKHRVFISVGGATLPSQSDQAQWLVPLKPFAHGVPNCLWVQTLPQLPEETREEGLWPLRFGAFAVHVDIHAGTIDEMVELYRYELLKAARKMLDTEHFTHLDVEKSVQLAARLGYTPGCGLRRDLVDLGEAPATEDYLRLCGENLTRIVNRAPVTLSPEGELPPHLRLDILQAYQKLLAEHCPDHVVNTVSRDVPEPGFLVVSRYPEKLRELAEKLPDRIMGVPIYFRVITSPQTRADVVQSSPSLKASTGSLEDCTIFQDLELTPAERGYVGRIRYLTGQENQLKELLERLSNIAKPQTVSLKCEGRDIRIENLIFVACGAVTLAGNMRCASELQFTATGLSWPTPVAETGG